jgi:hypothetical protein
MLFDGKDWWAEGRATNGGKAKADVQQGGVVGLEGGSWVAEKNGGNLLRLCGSGRIFAEFSFPCEITWSDFLQLSVRLFVAIFECSA